MIAAIFGTLWSRSPFDIVDEQAKLIVASVVAARDGYAEPPQWSAAGLQVAARVNSLVCELQRQLNREASKRMESEREHHR